MIYTYVNMYIALVTTVLETETESKNGCRK